MKMMRSLLVLTAALAAPMAYADSTASAPNSSTSSSTSQLLEKIGKNIKAVYEVDLTGPNTSALSGNKDGTTQLKLAHYPSVGYRIGSKWKVSVTQPFTQLIDNKPESEAQAFTTGDPYMTFANSRILGSDRYNANLSGFVRYYAPLSQANISARKAASPKDTGNGRVRIFLDPSISFLGGDLSFDLTHNLYLRLASRNDQDRIAANGNPYRNDMDYLPDFYVNYQLTKSLQPYIEFAALLHHTTDGHWTHFNTPDDGFSINPGVNIAVSKKLLIIPSATFGPKFTGLANAGLTLQTIYTFL